MNATFDTLAYARRMESVGFTRDQAEAMAEEQGKLIDERLATKADLKGVKVALKTNIGTTRLSTGSDVEQAFERLRHDLKILRLDLIVQLGGIVIASVAAGSTIVALFGRLAGHP